MKISELSGSTFQGQFIERNELNSKPGNMLYLTPDIVRNNFITEENARYVSDKYSKQFNKSQLLAYGDIVVYQKSDTEFGFFRFTQELNKSILPSPNFAVIRSPQGFLANMIQSESGKAYLSNEISDLWKHKEGNWKYIASELKNIVVPWVFEDDDISISPGSIPVSKEDFGKISIRKGLMSADNLIKRVHNKEIKIEGYFQRRSQLWDQGTKSRLIETLLLDIPVPPLYFDVVTKSEYLIIDGLQRISTIYDFTSDKFSLQDLDFLPELDGKKFSELERNYQRSIEEYELTTFAVQPGTPRMVRYKIFKNINTSALILTRQEIRHAMGEDETISGFTPSRYMRELGELVTKYITIPQGEVDRMYDRELGLRYVTFRMYFYKTDYKPSMADFLDQAADNMYSYSKAKLDTYKNELETVLSVLVSIFPAEIVFSKKMIDDGDGESESKKINGALFEIWTCAVAQQLLNNEAKVLISKADVIRRKTRALKTESIFMRAIDNRYSNSIEMVKTRFATITQLLKDALNDR